MTAIDAAISKDKNIDKEKTTFVNELIWGMSSLMEAPNILKTRLSGNEIIVLQSGKRSVGR